MSSFAMRMAQAARSSQVAIRFVRENFPRPPEPPPDLPSKATRKPPAVRRRDRRQRFKRSGPPSPKRVRAFQRRRDWAKHQEKRLEARNGGTHVRTLLARQASKARRGERALFAYPVPELLQETRSTVAIALAGWVAFAWLFHGHSQLVGSYLELAQLLGCKPKTVEKWALILRRRGWLMADYHYADDQHGVTWQVSNSYAPGLMLRMALQGAAEGRRRGALASVAGASFFAPPVQDPTKVGSVASLREESKNNSDAHARVEESPAATIVRRPLGGSPRTPAPLDAPATHDGLTGGESDATAQLSAPGLAAAARSEPSGTSARGAPPEAPEAQPQQRRPPPAFPGRTVVVRAEAERVRAAVEAERAWREVDGWEEGRAYLALLRRFTD